MLSDIDRAVSALHAIPNDLPGDDWLRLSMASKNAGVDFEAWHDWCKGASNYLSESDCRARWKSIDPDGAVKAGTLYKTAAEHGWRIGGNTTPRPAPERARKPAEPPRKPAPGQSASEVFNRCQPATASHGYIVKKQGTPDGLRVVAAADKLTIAGQNMAGYLAVPAYAPDGEIQSIQFIPPNGGKKLNLPGASMAGASFTLGTDGPLILCEGIGATWSAWKATGHRAVCCFGWGNVGKIAAELRQREPDAKMIVAPDVGKESAAAEIAALHQCAVAPMPEGWPDNSDINDLFNSPDGGFDVLAALLESATMPPVSYPVSVAFADELPDRYEPPDELIEGVLTAGDGSVLYGDSNSGKTFAVIDMACAVARGVPWMGKRTEPGLVVYLAAESPASVRGRLHAYQKHHGCKVPNFAIVQSPIDLFADDTDTNRIITLVQILERQRGQKVRLIVGDTLARLSAGANENAGQDMGLVVQRFDRIRTECKAHFLLIHHSGKAAAAGARGWSGIRAAVDTEIEISDSLSCRCLEITKQRDLSTKGQRIGFRLDVVTLGHTKWGEPATSCVVVASDAPVKAGKAIKLGETQQAVMALLRGAGKNMKVREIADQLAEQEITRTSVYNAVNRLRDVELVEVSGGVVHLIGGKS